MFILHSSGIFLVFNILLCKLVTHLNPFTTHTFPNLNRNALYSYSFSETYFSLMGILKLSSTDREKRKEKKELLCLHEVPIFLCCIVSVAVDEKFL